MTFSACNFAHQDSLSRILCYRKAETRLDQGEDPEMLVRDICNHTEHPINTNGCIHSALGVLAGDYLRDVDFSYIEASEKNLSGTLFLQIDFFSAKFAKANLARSTFIGVNLSHSDLHGANLESSRFGNNYPLNCEDSRFGSCVVTLTFANLINTNLSRASFAPEHWNRRLPDLRHANLEYANLRSARILADLRGANLQNTVIDAETDFLGAWFNSQTRLPFSREEALKKGMVYKE